MTSEEERCAKARRWERLDRAFRAGDLEAIRATLDGAADAASAELPDGFGSPLVYAVYHSPLPFIRTLLELGADPTAAVDDGFPPLLAAISSARTAPGAKPCTDLDDVIRLLLKWGADPQQRGINDYTALHMAVAERQHLVVQRLLDAGADPEVRTRIDDCDTPLEMAESAGRQAIAETLRHRGRPAPRRLRSGVTIVWDVPGDGPAVLRQQHYGTRIRAWLADGTAIRWPAGLVPAGVEVDPDVPALMDLRVNRGALISGVFYGVDGMRIGGTRCLDIVPGMAYGDRGVPGLIPANASLTIEITIVHSLQP